LRLDPYAAYLIIGGTGGLGFATARWMIERGARQITLASRSGALDESLSAQAQQWREEKGIRVDVAACDVTEPQAVERLITDIQARGTPLKGVVHSAMQIDDGLLRNLDEARLTAVLAPKVAGAWNLHRATRHRALDFFIVYSSATTFLGNPGQGSYVAANSFLEALVAHRRAAGLPGTFMSWGPLDDVGFLARHAQTREALQARIGGLSITSEEALAALERVLVAGDAGEALVRLDWDVISHGMPAAQARRYAMLQTHGARATSRESGADLRAHLCALPHADAVGLAAETLQAQIARILHLSPDAIDPNKSVLDMGMDSLMGMELGMAVEEIFEVRLSVMAIAEGASVNALATQIVEMVVAARNGGETEGGAEAEEVAAMAARHALDDEARAMLKIGSADPVGAGNAALTPETEPVE
jgi:phthiocerol/phenolphthiocerol synthesis type-I polyketide synthase C